MVPFAVELCEFYPQEWHKAQMDKERSIAREGQVIGTKDGW